MFPDLTGYILNKQFIIEVFPEPVRPQNATFSFFLILKLIFFKANY